jgi:hypothetical protein
MRTVNDHGAKAHISRLIDPAHAGETILPVEGRQPGVLRGRLRLPAPEVLLAPLPEEELLASENSPLP